jgi:quinol monooxygenase YgiN
MIHVIATIELNSGTRDDFLAEFRKVVSPVRAEQGCLEYGAAVDAATDIPAQGPLRPDVVTVVEKWSDVNALKAHLAAPHMLDYRPRVKPFVKLFSLQILEPATL